MDYGGLRLHGQYFRGNGFVIASAFQHAIIDIKADCIFGDNPGEIDFASSYYGSMNFNGDVSISGDCDVFSSVDNANMHFGSALMIPAPVKIGTFINISGPGKVGFGRTFFGDGVSSSIVRCYTVDLGRLKIASPFPAEWTTGTTSNGGVAS